MALPLTDPHSPRKFNLLFGKNYEHKLNESVQKILSETPNVSEFTDKFHEFIQSKLDPPLESIWVYAALKFKSQNSTKENFKDRIAAIKDLFGLITSCSASCSALKCVALIAPVVFEVYKLAVEFTGKELVSKRERKAVREIRAFVDVVVGYVGLCYEGVVEGCGVELGVGMDDLVRVWIGSDGEVKSFYPLVSDEVRGVVSSTGWDLDYFAGVVAAEVFLLKLCLSLRSGGERGEVEQELRSWAVGSITAFRNSYFLEMLVRMLLESTLPVTSVVGLEDEALSRKILLDSTVLVDYSFLNPKTAAGLPIRNMKNLVMASVIVTHEAVESSWKRGDRSKAISYLKAFSSSCLPSELIKCITSQNGIEEKPDEAYKSSPKSLLRWLLKLDARGERVFDDTISRCRAKLNLDVSKAEDYNMSKAKTKGTDASDLHYIDNKGEEDNMASDEAAVALVVAAHSMRSNEKRGSKRKEKRSAEMKKQIKFSKYELTDHSGTHRVELSSDGDDDMNSDSEVDNLSSDEDMEAEKN